MTDDETIRVATIGRRIRPLHLPTICRLQVFNTIIVEGVPQLTMSQATELRRLITMVDAFYDTQARHTGQSPS